MTPADNRKNSFTLWPYAVVVAMLLFMGYIASFVYRAMHQDVDLVSKDYYEQELAYQDRINTISRTNAMGEVAITYDAVAQVILIQLPENFADKSITGKVKFFRPSNDKLDFEVPLQLDTNQSQLLSAANLQKGFWKVRLHYNAGQEVYYTEKALMVE